NLRRGTPGEIAEHEGRRSRRGRPSMPSRADGCYALVTASIVGGRGSTGDSVCVKRFYQHTFIDCVERMTVPAFSPVAASPPFAAQFEVTPEAVCKAKSRVLRRRREEIGDLIDKGGTDRGRGQPGFPVTHGALTGMTTRATGAARRPAS